MKGSAREAEAAEKGLEPEIDPPRTRLDLRGCCEEAANAKLQSRSPQVELDVP